MESSLTLWRALRPEDSGVSVAHISSFTRISATSTISVPTVAAAWLSGTCWPLSSGRSAGRALVARASFPRTGRRWCRRARPAQPRLGGLRHCRGGCEVEPQHPQRKVAVSTQPLATARTATTIVSKAKASITVRAAGTCCRTPRPGASTLRKRAIAAVRDGPGGTATSSSPPRDHSDQQATVWASGPSRSTWCDCAAIPPGRMTATGAEHHCSGASVVAILPGRMTADLHPRDSKAGSCFSPSREMKDCTADEGERGAEPLFRSLEGR